MATTLIYRNGEDVYEIAFDPQSNGTMVLRCPSDPHPVFEECGLAQRGRQT